VKRERSIAEERQWQTVFHGLLIWKRTLSKYERLSLQRGVAAVITPQEEGETNAKAALERSVCDMNNGKIETVTVAISTSW
jgi:hypothetical protein